MKKQTHRLGDLQLKIMKVLWEKSEASVPEIHETLQTEKELAYTTIATMLRKMEARGLVKHRVEERKFIYAASVREDAVSKKMTEHLLDHLFEGQPGRHGQPSIEFSRRQPGRTYQTSTPDHRKEKEEMNLLPDHGYWFGDHSQSVSRHRRHRGDSIRCDALHPFRLLATHYLAYCFCFYRHPRRRRSHGPDERHGALVGGKKPEAQQFRSELLHPPFPPACGGRNFAGVIEDST